MTSPAPMKLTIAWWNELEDQWKKAFNEAVWRKGPALTPPNEEELEWLSSSPAIRFAGPQAPYPNMTFELTNLSGLNMLKHVETLVVTFHALRSIEQVAGLKRLKSLFVNNNLIASLDGVQALRQLEMLYVQHNELTDISAIRKLTKLREFYVHDNRIASLEGLREEHAKAMRVFVPLPNEELRDKEIMRIEREVGIRCQRISWS